MAGMGLSRPRRPTGLPSRTQLSSVLALTCPCPRARPGSVLMLAASLDPHPRPFPPGAKQEPSRPRDTGHLPAWPRMEVSDTVTERGPHAVLEDNVSVAPRMRHRAFGEPHGLLLYKAPSPLPRTSLLSRAQKCNHGCSHEESPARPGLGPRVWRPGCPHPPQGGGSGHKSGTGLGSGAERAQESLGRRSLTRVKMRP